MVQANPRKCGGSGGCQGGTAQVGFQHAIDADGLLSEWTYPYTSHGGLNAACTLNVTHGEDRVAAVASYVNIKTNDEASLLEARALLGHQRPSLSSPSPLPPLFFLSFWLNPFLSQRDPCTKHFAHEPDLVPNPKH